LQGSKSLQYPQDMKPNTQSIRQFEEEVISNDTEVH